MSALPSILYTLSAPIKPIHHSYLQSKIRFCQIWNWPRPHVRVWCLSSLGFVRLVLQAVPFHIDAVQSQKWIVPESCGVSNLGQMSANCQGIMGTPSIMGDPWQMEMSERNLTILPPKDSKLTVVQTQTSVLPPTGTWVSLMHKFCGKDLVSLQNEAKGAWKLDNLAVKHPGSLACIRMLLASQDRGQVGFSHFSPHKKWLIGFM